jgi:20S proteasome alpha/beta subunit
MTTLIGMVTNDQHVILAADRCYTLTNKEEDQREYLSSKIISFNNKYSIASCGEDDEFYTNFLKKFVKGRINFEQKLKKEFFSEVLNLNAKRNKYEEMDSDTDNCFLIAAKIKSYPNVYYIYSCGKIEEITKYVCIGGGGEFAQTYLEERYQFFEVDVKKGIELTYNAMKEASKSVGTFGFDFVVMGKNKTYNYINFMQKGMDLAEKKLSKKMISNFPKH